MAKFKEVLQSFTNMEPTYIIQDNELVELELIDLQAKLNSCRPDSITDLFNKYESGQPLYYGAYVNTEEVNDDTELVSTKDKVDAAMKMKQKQKEMLELAKKQKELEAKIEQDTLLAMEGQQKENDRQITQPATA